LKEGVNPVTGMTDFVIIRIRNRDYPAFTQALLEAGVDARLPETSGQWSRFVSIQLYFQGRKFATGDVNGDGRSDVAAYFRRGRNTGQWSVSLHRQQAEFSTPVNISFDDEALYLSEYATPLFADINGDDLSDLVIAEPGHPWKIMINQGEWKFTQSAQHITLSGLPSLDDLYQPLTGDFNGDGMDDAAVNYLKGEYAGRWFIALNAGKNGFGVFNEYPLNSGNMDLTIRYFPLILDFNGDGFDDCIIYFQDGELNASWFIGLNHQKNGFDEPFRVYFGNSPLAFYGDYYPFTGDFNADGYDDLIVKSGTQDETGEWYLEYNQAGINFTYGHDVLFDHLKDLINK